MLAPAAAVAASRAAPVPQSSSHTTRGVDVRARRGAVASGADIDTPQATPVPAAASLGARARGMTLICRCSNERGATH